MQAEMICEFVKYPCSVTVRMLKAHLGFDGAYRVRNAQTGQYAPFMIPPSETPRDLSNWISEARAANNLSDLQLAMSTELVRLGHIIESVKSAESMSEHFKNYIFGLIRELRQKWLDGPGV